MRSYWRFQDLAIFEKIKENLESKQTHSIMYWFAYVFLMFGDLEYLLEVGEPREWLWCELGNRIERDLRCKALISTCAFLSQQPIVLQKRNRRKPNQKQNNAKTSNEKIKNEKIKNEKIKNENSKRKKMESLISDAKLWFQSVRFYSNSQWSSRRATKENPTSSRTWPKATSLDARVSECFGSCSTLRRLVFRMHWVRYSLQHIFRWFPYFARFRYISSFFLIPKMC